MKSTALRLGNRTRPWLAGFYGAAAALLTAAGLAAGLGWPFLLAVAAAAAHFAWQVAGLDTENPKDCLLRFKSNRFVGWILLAGLLAESALAGLGGV